ncbi:MAG: hypothetical protein ABFE13_14830 [Phycisphaerales bacterium]
MTHREIEAARRELQGILDKHEAKAQNDAGTARALRELAKEVGASTQTVFLKNTVYGTTRECNDASIPELTYNIHFALQTASMVDACRTAAENTSLIAESVRLTEQSLGETQRSSRWAVRTAWAAIVTAAGTVGAAIAAWFTLR